MPDSNTSVDAEPTWVNEQYISVTVLMGCNVVTTKVVMTTQLLGSHTVLKVKEVLSTYFRVPVDNKEMMIMDASGDELHNEETLASQVTNQDNPEVTLLVWYRQQHGIYFIGSQFGGWETPCGISCGRTGTTWVQLKNAGPDPAELWTRISTCDTDVFWYESLRFPGCYLGVNDNARVVLIPFNETRCSWKERPSKYNFADDGDICIESMAYPDHFLQHHRGYLIVKEFDRPPWSGDPFHLANRTWRVKSVLMKDVSNGHQAKKNWLNMAVGKKRRIAFERLANAPALGAETAEGGADNAPEVPQSPGHYVDRGLLNEWVVDGADHPEMVKPPPPPGPPPPTDNVQTGDRAASSDQQHPPEEGQSTSAGDGMPPTQLRQLMNEPLATHGPIENSSDHNDFPAAALSNMPRRNLSGP